ncbi:MAG: KdsC family phosphatase [Nitrospiria bacterium]
MVFPQDISESLLEKAKQIRYVLLDVDGVMTNGLLFFDEAGGEIKVFSIYDGLGISLLHKAGIGVGIISGRSSPIVARRAKELHVEDLYQGVGNKVIPYKEILERRHLDRRAVAFIGDDLIDLPLLRKVGFPIAVANAVDAVKGAADWVTQRKGGEGAVREVIDFILSAQKVEGEVGPI